MVVNGNEECRAKSYGPKLEKKTSEIKQQKYFQMSSWFDPRV